MVPAMTITKNAISIGSAKRPYFQAVTICLGLGIASCSPATQPANGSKTAVNLDAPAASKATEEAPFVFFEGEAKAGVPPEVDDFVTNFFEAVKKDWRSGVRFMDAENYKEVFASNGRLDPIENDAGILVLSISLHRFHGGDEPMDTDTDVQRLQAISKVHVTKFEQNEQVFNLWGKTELKDGRVYGLTMVIAKGQLGILCPL